MNSQNPCPIQNVTITPKQLPPPTPQRGAVYTTKECQTLAEPVHGRVGWKIIRLAETHALIEEVFFYGKGGIAEWRTHSEFEMLKQLRAKEWKKTEGVRHFKERLRDPSRHPRSLQGCYAP